MPTKLLLPPQKGAWEKCQVGLTLRSHLEYNVHASVEAVPAQELALGLVDMDMPVSFRWCACVRGYGQVKPFELSDMDHQQTCSRSG